MPESQPAQDGWRSRSNYWFSQALGRTSYRSHRCFVLPSGTVHSKCLSQTKGVGAQTCLPVGFPQLPARGCTGQEPEQSLSPLLKLFLSAQNNWRSDRSFFGTFTYFGTSPGSCSKEYLCGFFPSPRNGKYTVPESWPGKLPNHSYMHSCLFLPLLSGLVKYRFSTHSGRSSTKREAVPFYPQSSGHVALPGGGSLSSLTQKRYRAQVCQIVRKYSTQRPKKLHSREKQNFLFSLYFGGVVKKLIKKECLSFY